MYSHLFCTEEYVFVFIEVCLCLLVDVKIRTDVMWCEQTSEDVAQFNVISMMHEVALRSQYKPANDVEESNIKPLEQQQTSSGSASIENNFSKAIGLYD